MTATARKTIRRIAAATRTAAAFLLATIAADFKACELCELAAAELFDRVDNRDGADVRVCEHCADTADVGPADES